MIPKGFSMIHISSILDDLKQYIGSNLITYERYNVPYEEIETRKDIRFARIALYEQTDSVTDQVNDYRANLSLVSFAIDVSVIRAYRGDNDTRGEEPLLNLRDIIVEWSKQVDVPTLTNEYILAFGYNTSANIIRNDKFVSRTITFDAVKDLHKPQAPLETFTETFDETFD